MIPQSLRRPLYALISFLALASVPLFSPAQSQPASAPTVPMDKTIAAIRDEGLNHSHVMQTLDYLCNVIGPRLTGSPELKRANEWTRDQFTAMGMTNAHLEPWGPFGKGWTLKRFSLEVIAPLGFPIRPYPKAWSPGLERPIQAELVYMDAATVADLAKYDGQLKGKIVLIGNPRSLTPAFQPPAKRLADEDLARSETYASGTPLVVTGVTPAPAARGGRGRGAATTTATASAPGTAPGTTPSTAASAPAGRGGPGGAAQAVAQRALSMAASQGALMILDCSNSGDGGIIAVERASVPTPAGPATGPATGPGPATGAGGAGGGGGRGGSQPYALNAPNFPAEATLAIEDFDRLARMIRQGQSVTMAAAMEVQFQTQDPMAYNTIAEIPGSDLKDQIVMAGAHMDSWHGGTGATDNGAGCGAVIEAVRILRALNLQPRRTIRVALWSGEEQGLLGSTAYVAQHFAGTPAGRGGRGTATASAPATTAPAGTSAAPAVSGGGRGGGRGAARGPVARGPEYDKLSVYFNLDNGTGKIRGIYAQGNDAGGVLFKKWFEPFADLGAKTVTLGTNGQTDHVPFDDAGLPGFEFIQDSIDYLSRTHHTTADVYDRLQADDMKVNATLIAAFLWDAANMDQRFPRRPAAGRGGPAQTLPVDPASTQPIRGAGAK